MNKINREKSERDKRYKEYLELKNLSFYSFEQLKRFTWIKQQRVLDNKYAFMENLIRKD